MNDAAYLDLVEHRKQSLAGKWEQNVCDERHCALGMMAGAI